MAEEQKYKVILDGKVIEENLSYEKASLLLCKLDASPDNFFKNMSIKPMEDKK